MLVDACGCLWMLVDGYKYGMLRHDMVWYDVVCSVVVVVCSHNCIPA